MLSEQNGESPGFLDYVELHPEDVASDAVLAVLMAEYRSARNEVDSGRMPLVRYVSACVDIVMSVRSRASGRRLLQNYLSNY